MGREGGLKDADAKVQVILREGLIGQNCQSAGHGGWGQGREGTSLGKLGPSCEGALCPCFILVGGRVMESPDMTRVLCSHRIDCFRGGDTRMRQGWSHGVLLGEGKKAQRRQMRARREDEDELALEAISGGGARGGEREESEMTLRRET